MNTSYKRYWEPSLAQVLGISLPVGALAQFITQPAEFVKVRTQVRAEGVGLQGKRHYMGINPNKVFREVHETGQGMRGFYWGFEAALCGRLVYLFLRNFLHKVVYDQVKPVKPSNDLTTREKAVLAASVGGVAAFLTSPFELIMTRQIADGGIPAAFRRNYQGLTHAWNTITAQEGVSGLFRGSFAHVFRLAVLNMSLTGPYDYLNEKMFLTFGGMSWNEPVSITWATLWASLFTLPIDNIKTRLMRQFPDPAQNRLSYHNFRHAFQQTLRYEGVAGFYAGFYAYFLKMYITCFLTVYLTNSFTNSAKRRAGLQEWQI